MSAQIQFDFGRTVSDEQADFWRFECDPGAFALIKECGPWGFYLWERCYVHEVHEDGYLVEICNGLTWGNPWGKDGTILKVSLTALGRYDHRSFMNRGAHYVETIDDILERIRERLA